jgi:DNA polymerase-3 subunit gamma/tau
VAEALMRYQNFDQVIELIRARRDMKLLVDVEGSLRLAKYTPGRVEFQPTNNAPKDLATRLSQKLQVWTGARWAISVVSEGGGDTIYEVKSRERDDMQGRALQHPLVKSVMELFPGAEIRDIRQPEDLTEGAVEYLEEVEDEWDPFEDE